MRFTRRIARAAAGNALPTSGSGGLAHLTARPRRRLSAASRSGSRSRARSPRPEVLFLTTDGASIRPPPRRRGHLARHRAVRRQDRDGDARPRTGAPARRRDRVHAARDVGEQSCAERFFTHPQPRRAAPHPPAISSSDVTEAIHADPPIVRHRRRRGRLVGFPALAQEKSSSCVHHSTEDSGLFGHILPIFRQTTGIDVR